MSPYAQAKALCEAQGYQWTEILSHFGEHGYIYFDADCGLIAQRLDDTYWVWLAVGGNPLQRFCELAPYPLPYVAWARSLRGREEPKIYRFERVKRLCAHLTKSKGQCHEHGKTTEASSPSSARPSGLCGNAGRSHGSP